MTEFIRLPSKILNLSHIREISFDESDAEVAIRWVNGDITVLGRTDASMFTEYLERHYGLMTVPAVKYDEDALDLDEDEIEVMFPISMPHTAV